MIGLPDEKWGERVVAVSARTPARRSTRTTDAFVKERIGSVKAPKEVAVWPDLPRSKVGKVLKADIRSSVLASHADE